ncbi:hypothetical protein D9757_008247 [Collybiopsis confluens]|uniref:Uncharacterized protein n=1 Tax=Collybiopsis confluens TaxID=2823264 RepID=A0A8H5HBM3_9AGAR|nr:hypothetical protein D9757_008247 [Collybiopsis confluens]
MTSLPSILLRATTTRRLIYPVHALRCQRTFATSKTLSKTAIVSGSGRGIGKAIALRLARDGFDVCVNDLEHNSSSVESVVNEIKSLGRNALPVYADVSKCSQVESMVETSVAALGPLDVIVANAGIAKIHLGLDATEADTQSVLAVNFYGVLWQDQAAAKQFIKQGAGGKIINCASIVAFRPFPMSPIYCASKAAVRSLTQSFAMELAKHKITVNAYAPGIVDTQMAHAADEIYGVVDGLPKGSFLENAKSMIALGRTSVPEDVAKMVSYLASPDSDYVTGQTMIVDGGIVFS